MRLSSEQGVGESEEYSRNWWMLRNYQEMMETGGGPYGIDVC